MKRDMKPGTYLYPVPAVLVTCGLLHGNPNIITIAWTGTLASAPPQVGISIRPKRFSYEIIEENREFAINLPHVEMVRELDYCGMVSGRDVDKFKECGFTPLQGQKIKSSVIKEAPVNIECQVKEILPLGSHHLFLGEVVHVQIHEDLFNSKGDLLLHRFKAITYMGKQYYGLGDLLGDFGFSQE